MTRHRCLLLALLIFAHIPGWSQRSFETLDFPEITKKEKGLLEVSLYVGDRESRFLAVGSGVTDIFVDDQLLYEVHNDTLPLEMLGRGRVDLTLYSPNGDLDARLIYQIKDTQLSIQERMDRGFTNFVSVFATILLVFIAIIKWFQSKNLNEFLRLDNMFSPRNKDENILRNKVMTSSNAPFVVFFILIGSGLAVMIQELLDPNQGSFIYYLLEWMLWIGYVSLFLLVKYVLISFFIYVFNIHNYFGYHIINYLRISIFFVSVWTLAIFFIIWFDGSPMMIQWVISSLVVSVVFRTVILFLKLINTANYRLFHLFSYLCGTEILPFFWLILLASNLF